MNKRRPETPRAVARGDTILRVIFDHYVGRDRTEIPALVLARGTRDDETRRALVILEEVDELVVVDPRLVDLFEPAHTVKLTAKGREWMRAEKLRRAEKAPPASSREAA